MSAQQHPDAWWLGYVSAEVGAFLAGMHPVESLRAVYREFYRSSQVQGDAEFKRYLPPPTNRKIKVKG